MSTTTEPIHEPAPQLAAAEPARPWLSYLSFRRISAIYLLLLLMLVFSVWVPDTFWTTSTFRSILGDQSVTALVAVGLVVALAAGAFDLSVGLALGAANVNVMYLIVHQGWAMGPAIAASMLFGVLVGSICGLLVARARFDSFIATMGVSSVLTAYVVWVSDNQQIVGDPTSGFSELATSELLGISASFWFMLGVAALAWYVLTYRPVGRRLYATGGGPEAARLAGVRVRSLTFGALLTSSVVASAAGLMLASRIGVGSPTVGAPYMIPAFAAAFLGSTQLTAGRFNVWGTVLAVYVLAVGVKGLQLAGAPFFVADLFNGVALIFAVWLARLERRPRTRRTEDARQAEHA